MLSVEQEVAATSSRSPRCAAVGRAAALLVIGNLVTGEHSFNGDRPDLLEEARPAQTRFVLDAMLRLHAAESSAG
ncbi:MAG: hypothetical protein U0869_05135 [Chloroflexota bacterium]